MKTSNGEEATWNAKRPWRSIERLFSQFETEFLHFYSHYALIVIRVLRANPQAVYFFTDRIERIATFVPGTRTNYLYALAICWAVESYPAKKEEILKKIQRLFPRRTHDLNDLDFMLMLDYDEHFSFGPVLGALVSRFDFPKIVEHNGVSNEMSVYVRVWFSLANGLPDVSQKRAAICSHGGLWCFIENFSDRRHLVGKTLVNLLAEDPNPRFQKIYLRALKSMSRRYSSDAEFQGIYSRGLLNHLSDSGAKVGRRPSFRELYRLHLTVVDSPVVQENYASAIFCLALEEKRIVAKRRWIRALLDLLQMPSLSPGVFQVAAQTLFNHMIDESSVQHKRKALKLLEKLSVRTGNSPGVCREYARALVNMLVDDPTVKRKQLYFKTLESLAGQMTESDEITLEYVKGLMNFALVCPEPEAKAWFIVGLQRAVEEREPFRNEATEHQELRRDFLCLYAESQILSLVSGMDCERKLDVLGRLPSIEQICESEYFYVFVDVLNKIYMVEKDQEVEEILWELVKEVRPYLGLQKENRVQLELESETLE